MTSLPPSRDKHPEEPSPKRLSKQYVNTTSTFAEYMANAGYTISTIQSRFEISIEPNVQPQDYTVPIIHARAYDDAAKTNLIEPNGMLIGAFLEILSPERKPDGINERELVVEITTPVISPQETRYDINKRLTILAPVTEPVFVPVGWIDIGDVYDKGFAMVDNDHLQYGYTLRLMTLFELKFRSSTSGLQLLVPDSTICRMTLTFAKPIPTPTDPLILVDNSKLNGSTFDEIYWDAFNEKKLDLTMWVFSSLETLVNRHSDTFSTVGAIGAGLYEAYRRSTSQLSIGN